MSELGPLPEMGYLGDDASYGYDAEDMRAYALAEVQRAVAIEIEWRDTLEKAIETLVDRCNSEFGIASDPAVIAAEAALERLYRWRTGVGPNTKGEQK